MKILSKNMCTNMNSSIFVISISESTKYLEILKIFKFSGLVSTNLLVQLEISAKLIENVFP